MPRKRINKNPNDLSDGDFISHFTIRIVSIAGLQIQVGLGTIHIDVRCGESAISAKNVNQIDDHRSHRSQLFRFNLPDFRLFVSFRTVENARFTRIECRLTDRKNGSVSGPNRGVSGGALRSKEKKLFITSIFIIVSFCFFFFSSRKVLENPIKNWKNSTDTTHTIQQ